MKRGPGEVRRKSPPNWQPNPESSRAHKSGPARSGAGRRCQLRARQTRGRGGHGLKHPDSAAHLGRALQPSHQDGLRVGPCGPACRVRWLPGRRGQDVRDAPRGPGCETRPARSDPVTPRVRPTTAVRPHRWPRPGRGSRRRVAALRARRAPGSHANRQQPPGQAGSAAVAPHRSASADERR